MTTTKAVRETIRQAYTAAHFAEMSGDYGEAGKAMALAASVGLELAWAPPPAPSFTAQLTAWAKARGFVAVTGETAQESAKAARVALAEDRAMGRRLRSAARRGAL